MRVAQRETELSSPKRTTHSTKLNTAAPISYGFAPVASLEQL
jgi:hypothetical protein